MTTHQMLLALPELPLPVTALAARHAQAGNWPRFRDYLRGKGVASIEQRREAFDAAGLGHSANLATPQEVAAEAAARFPNFFCMECAASIQEALQQRGMHGTILDLKTRNALEPYGNIWSDQQNEVIAENGRHRAIQVDDTVFDNHNPNGVPFPQWRIDHRSPGYSEPGTIPLDETVF